MQGVLTASTNAQTTIKASTTTIMGSDVLSLTDALTLQQSATTLTTSANTTIQSLITKKPIFDQLGATSAVAMNLMQQKTAAAALGTAIVSKVPAIGQSIAQSSIDQINTVLDQGIAAYSTGATTAASNSTGAATGKAGAML